MINAFRDFTDAGGLMSCGATVSEIYASGAEQVAKILGGTRSSELPVREATRFELVINNRTAKGIGLTIPPSSNGSIVGGVVQVLRSHCGTPLP